MSADHGIHWHVRHIEETGSTNADLAVLLDDATSPGETPPDHLVLRTDHQTAGRGRLDRRWDAPSGSNLLFSVLFLRAPDRPHTLTQAVSLAAVRAVDRLVGWDAVESLASLKWPNDVLLDGRKLAGLLAQRHRSGAVIAGMGLNVGWAPEGAAKLTDLDAVPADLTPGAVLDVLLDELSALAPDGRFDDAAVMAAARTRTSTIGAAVRVELPGGDVVEGTATAIDDDGRLVVERGGRVDRFDVGDIVHLRRPR